MSSLILALDHGDSYEISHTLEHHPEDINIFDEEDRTPLHYAAKLSVEICEAIYEADPKQINATDKSGCTPLIVSLMEGNIDVADYLASKGANVHSIDNNGHNAIHWSVVCGQLESLEWAIKKEVNLNAKDFTQECMAVHYATACDDIPSEVGEAILLTLLSYGATPNGRDADERTPIHWCASNGNVSAMNALYKSGGDLRIKDQDQLSILHCAASHGYHGVIDFAKENGFDNMIDEQDKAGHTALFYAVSFGHYESAKRLLAYGANPNHQDQRLRTPAHNAAAKGQMRMLSLLRSYNSSFGIQNYRGDTPFHEAVQSGSKDVVSWLLASDQTVINIPNHNGRTALHLAAAAGNLEMVILLCNLGAKIDPLMSINSVIYTPLDLAVDQNHINVINYFKTHSAKSRADFSDEYIEDWKTNFQDYIAKAKLDRDQMILERKTRRPSTTENRQDIVVKNEKGTLTSQRSVSSAKEATRSREYFSKATSVTSLERNELERLKTEIDNDKDKINGGFNIDDDEFENLPPFSDESDISISSYEEDDDKTSQESEVERKITVKENKATNEKKKGKTNEDDKKKEAMKTNQNRLTSDTKNNKKLVMRVRREPEVGNDGGDVDIYDEGEGKQSDDEAVLSPFTLGGKRYIHERAIFQELTHLKRMQIQYGKVQEKVLVRSLVSNFCKMHGLNSRNFKFQTFYAWEKFLYDALSEQLKIMYLDERERLTETTNDMMRPTQSMKLSRFDSKIRKTIPSNDRLRDMQQVYSHSSISSKRQTVQKSNGTTKTSLIDGKKRCDCLERHILL